MSEVTEQIHIAHIVYSFATGGLENGMVNLLNRLPNSHYRHSIICITGHDENFYRRITNNNVDIYDLNKRSGKGLDWLWRCIKLLRKLKPDICHTRNLNAMEAQFAAFLTGVNIRIHGEHGWDVNDLGGCNKKFRFIRKCLAPFVHRFIGLSKESCVYLEHSIGVKPKLINHICNGVDTSKFVAPTSKKNLDTFSKQTDLVFGTVGRLAEVKNQTLLVQAFIDLWQTYPAHQDKLKLVIIGDGILMPEIKAMVEQANISKSVYLPGRRDDIAELIKAMDVFVLPSLAEGISNTILEAMATGLPVIATRVGGNPDLIMPAHQQSHLVSCQSPQELTRAMALYLEHPEKLVQDKLAAREHCVKQFSLDVMVNKYHQLYQQSYGNAHVALKEVT